MRTEKRLAGSFYTLVFQKSAESWVALCLENGLVGQGRTKREAVQKMKEALSSFEAVCQEDTEITSLPISIGELHEFLAPEETTPSHTERYELQTVSA